MSLNSRQRRSRRCKLAKIIEAKSCDTVITSREGKVRSAWTKPLWTGCYDRHVKSMTGVSGPPRPTRARFSEPSKGLLDLAVDTGGRIGSPVDRKD